MEIEEVHAFIMDNLDGVVPLTTWGETAYFYNPGQVLKRGAYFATIKEKNGENDKSSRLDRDGVWRLNMGVTKATFFKVFGHTPVRPAKGCIIEGPWDFAELNKLTPHPIYGWMSWMSVLNPDVSTFEICKPLILNAHQRASQTFAKRMKVLSHI